MSSDSFYIGQKFNSITLDTGTDTVPTLSQWYLLLNKITSYINGLPQGCSCMPDFSIPVVFFYILYVVTYQVLIDICFLVFILIQKIFGHSKSMNLYSMNCMHVHVGIAAGVYY